MYFIASIGKPTWNSVGLPDRPDRPQRVIMSSAISYLRSLGSPASPRRRSRPRYWSARPRRTGNALLLKASFQEAMPGIEVVVELLGVSSALTVSGRLLRITLSFLSTRLPPCTTSAQCAQALPSPVSVGRAPCRPASILLQVAFILQELVRRPRKLLEARLLSTPRRGNSMTLPLRRGGCRSACFRSCP